MNNSFNTFTASLDVQHMNRVIDGLFDVRFHTARYRDKYQEIGKASKLPERLRKLANEIEANQ